MLLQGNSIWSEANLVLLYSYILLLTDRRMLVLPDSFHTRSFFHNEKPTIVVKFNDFFLSTAVGEHHFKMLCSILCFFSLYEDRFLDWQMIILPDREQKIHTAARSFFRQLVYLNNLISITSCYYILLEAGSNKANRKSY